MFVRFRDGLVRGTLKTVRPHSWRKLPSSAGLVLLLLGCSEYGPVEYISAPPTVAADSSASVAVFAMLYVEQREARGIAAFPDGGIPKIERQGVWAYRCDELGQQARSLGLISRTGIDFNKTLRIVSVTPEAFTLVLIPFNRSDTVAYRVQVDGGITTVANPVASPAAPVQLGSFCQAAYVRLQNEGRSRATNGFNQPPPSNLSRQSNAR